MLPMAPADSLRAPHILEEGGMQTISITDISGRVVLSVSGQHRLDVTALYAGTYVVMSLGARPVRFVKQ